ncbi:hypothetical protein F2P79_025921 [Pimephales promelas]|nr:hypothetical protein F2P79_025921 [Pimephales promelas]
MLILRFARIVIRASAINVQALRVHMRTHAHGGPRQQAANKPQSPTTAADVLELDPLLGSVKGELTQGYIQQRQYIRHKQDETDWTYASHVTPSWIVYQSMIKPGSNIEATIGWDLRREDLITILIYPPPGKTKHQISVNALNGQPLPNINYTTESITLITSGNHIETIKFLLMNSPLTPVVLGHPWLTLHNPRVDWGHNSVSTWSNKCHESCLVSACSSVPVSEFQEKAVNLSNVPEEYQDLREVFSKSRAASLPPHRPYDCAIDLEPAGAGFFFVGKRDGSLRPCIDYRGLNNITVKNTYPLPLMSSAFERLQGASIFTKLDLRNAYHLVRMRKGDEWKTAFNTPRGHFEYLVMPFGLSNSPAVFQALVNDVLRDMVDQFIYVYLDDILIFSSSLQEHVRHVRRVLQRLLENGLFVKAEKCVFHAQSVPFLGYIVSSEGMRMDPDKVKAVIDWPSPDSRKALQRFLGFANFYRRFIRNFSQLAAPLTALTSPRTTFRWSETAEAAFAKLKSRFVSAPILVTPDPSRQFVVEVDASEVGVGAVLSQRSSTDDRMHPCAFFSHRLSSAERNYDIGNRELLAVKLALEEWRHWLEGSGVPFIVWTDHKNLEYIRTAKRLNSRQARWALFFGRFDFSLSYRPGSKNIKPDSLSRIFDQSERPSTPECILPETLVVSTLRWEVESKVMKALEGVTPPPDCPPNRLFVPEECRSDVIQWGHCSSVACHPEVNRIVIWSGNDSGGHLWLVTSAVLSWLALFVPLVNPPIDPQMGYSNRCLSLRDPGPTSH